MIDVCLLGTGGMMPLPGRFLTSLYARVNGKCMLIDCGEATQIALRKSGLSAKPVDVIALTHYHADHVSGLPGFLLTMGNSSRTEPVTMIGPAGLERVVSSLRVIAPRLPFELRFIELEGAEGSLGFGDFSVEYYRLDHDMLCYGYAMTVRRPGRFNPENARALGIPVTLWNRLQKGESVTSGDALITPEMVMGPERRGVRVTYCTDTRPCPPIITHAREADLFICEGMYGDPSMQDKARAYRHMTFQEAAHLARDAGAGELWLTHFSPSMANPEEFIHLAREIFPAARIGRDGQSRQLGFAGEE